jgi:tyrosinase
MGKPSTLNQTLYPGAKSRYDDFVAVHINFTLTIHGTGNFLGWHRYFVYAYEQALRNECGYKGYQPVSPTQIDADNGYNA